MQNSPSCSYIHHENGTHEFVLHQSNIEAFDEYLGHLTQVYNIHKELSGYHYVGMLLNVSGVELPATKAFRKLNAWLQTHPTPPDRKIRTAIVHRDSIAFSISSNFINFLRLRITVRLFTIENYDDAMAWLLAEAPETA